MNIRKVILLLTAALIFIGCSEQSQKEVSKNTTSLGTLQTRDRIIRLEINGNFSVLDLNGRLLALSLSKPEFQKKFPLLYQDLEKAIASGKVENIIQDSSMAKPTNEILK